MTHMRRNSLLALLLTASVAVSGCSSISKMNPFNKGDDGPTETAAEGERIAIVAADQTLEVAEALKGADFFLPTPEVNTSWSQAGGSPDQASSHPEAGGSLSVAWKRGFGEGSNRGSHVTAPPVAADGKIFVMDGGAAVSAIDGQTGAVRWKVDLRPGSRRDKEAFGGGLAFVDGKLYVTSGYRFAAQLDANTGAVLWKTTTEQPLHAAPTISGGRLFVVAVDNTLLTFDTATGAAGWNYQALSEPARQVVDWSTAPGVPHREGDTHRTRRARHAPGTRQERRSRSKCLHEPERRICSWPSSAAGSRRRSRG